uniref:Uncharacterized protein n=1 Tax=Acrobeloides nanus TaxID=290746 RepID=A0A914EA93_9BILA
MHNEFDKDFKDIKNMTEKMWVELMEMELTTDIQQLRMHRREASHYTNSVAQYGSYADYDKEPNGYTVPPITAPSYGYGWSRLKCCCAMYPERYYGGMASLEVSHKCPVGPRGHPGQPGTPGDPGYDGQSGTSGEDYPTVPAGLSHKSGISSVFSDFIEQQPYCDPCQRGLPGQQGAKGPPGIRGSKGHRGNGGRHGIHGIPGNNGPIGDPGLRGRSGRSGVPGPRGADGIRGAKGAIGALGTPGASGIPGQRGVTGPSGSMGMEGRRGPPGIPGIKGQRGMDGFGGYPGNRGQPGQDGMYCQCPEKTHAVAYYENQPQPSNDYQSIDTVNPPLNPPALPDDYSNQPVNNEASLYSPSNQNGYVSQEALKYAKPVYIRNGISNNIASRPFNNGQIQVPPTNSEDVDFLNSFSVSEPFTISRGGTTGDVTGGGGSFDIRADG